MNPSSLESRIRQIAIMVASADSVTARQILLNLPTDVARRVRSVAADLGQIPAEEKRALLAEFQRTAVLASSSSVADTASADSAWQNSATPASSGSTGHSTSATRSHRAVDAAVGQWDDLIPPSNSRGKDEVTTSDSSAAWTRLSVDGLVRLIRGERPTVIAIVVQQLASDRAAAILQQLPRTTTREVLRCLGSIRDIDAQAMAEIDDHLSQRLEEYRHKIESEIENSRRQQALLAAAPAELRNQWLQWMQMDAQEQSSQQLAPQPAQPSATSAALKTLDELYREATITTSDIVAPKTEHSVPSQLTALGKGTSPGGITAPGEIAVFDQKDSEVQAASSAGDAGVGSTIAERLRSSDSNQRVVSQHSAASEMPATIPFRPKATIAQPAIPAPNDIDRAAIQAQLNRMLDLPAEQLAELLSSQSSSTILLTMAGASESFINRFYGMLEPEDAKTLDDRLKRLGSTSLREIDQAQLTMVSAFLAMLRTETGGRRAAA